MRGGDDQKHISGFFDYTNRSTKARLVNCVLAVIVRKSKEIKKMKKYVATSVALVFAVVVVSMALAAAVKLDLVPYDLLEPDASGKATVNIHKVTDKDKGTVANVNVQVQGLVPAGVYTVHMGTPFTEIGTITANKKGKGHLHVNFTNDSLPDCDYTVIAVNNAGNFTVLMN